MASVFLFPFFLLRAILSVCVALILHLQSGNCTCLSAFLLPMIPSLPSRVGG